MPRLLVSVKALIVANVERSKGIYDVLVTRAVAPRRSLYVLPQENVQSIAKISG